MRFSRTTALRGAVLLANVPVVVATRAEAVALARDAGLGAQYRPAPAGAPTSSATTG